jgi:hypothetical protein
MLRHVVLRDVLAEAPSTTASVVRTATPAPVPAVRVAGSGWGQAAGSTWVTATVRDDGTGAATAAVTFTAFGSGGRVLAFGTSAATSLGTRAAGGLRALAVDPLVMPAAPSRCSVYTAVTAS